MKTLHGGMSVRKAKSNWNLLVSIMNICVMGSIPTTVHLWTPTHKRISKKLNSIPTLRSTPLLWL